MKEKTIRYRVSSLVIAVMLVVTTLMAFPTAAFAKKTVTKLVLSSKKISISADKKVTVTTNIKNAKIRVIVEKPDIASVAMKSQKGKKTVFTVMPKIKGSTKVTFISGKKKATLQVTVTKSSFDSIKNGFSAQLFTSQGQSGAVNVMIHNHTGLKAYCSNFVTIHGDIDYDGHWFDPSADYASQSASQYAVIGENEDRQIDYFNAPVYGLRFDSIYNLMTFDTQASLTMTVYFDQPTAENAYLAVIDTNGLVSLTKQ